MHESSKANLPCCTEGRVLTRCFSSASSWRVWKLLVEERNFNIVQCNEYKVCWCWNHCSAIFCILIKMCIKITSCLSLLPSILRCMLNCTGFSGYHEKVLRKAASRFLLLYLWKSLPLPSSRIYILTYRDKLHTLTCAVDCRCLCLQWYVLMLLIQF